jgi:choline-sulfatase
MFTSSPAPSWRGRGVLQGLQGISQSALVGTAVGLLEGGRALSLGAGVGSAAVMSGCALLAGTVVAAALVVLASVAPMLPWPARWRRAWRETPRGLLAWRVALGAGAIAVLAAVTYRAAAYVHVAFRFNEPGPVALLLTGVVLATVIGVGAAALLVDAAVAQRLHGAPAGQVARASRWRRLGLLLAGGLAAVGLPVLVVRWTVPALNLAPVVTYAALVAGVGLVRSTAATWTTGRGWIVMAAGAGLALLFGAAGLFGSTRDAAARGAAVSTGVLSKLALQRLWALGDGDGDGYAGPGFGGADCDDGDLARSPAAIEVAGNGIDENCSGADGAVAALAPRLAAPTTPEPSALLRPNVLLISFDALRADHLGAWNYRPSVSPHLDALAARSARFSWAMTSCPSTRCAIPALLTGRYAAAISAKEEVPTLAGTLAAAGWDTATITCCERFTSDDSDLAGFALVDSSADALRQKRAGQSNSDLVVDKVVSWLGRRVAAKTTAPFFLWTHLYDPHAPYQAPRSPRRFGDRDVDRYDAEIQFADEQVGELLFELDRLALSPNTIVVVTSDHGDEFGEHGIRFHARSLFNQVIRVPLLVYLPPAQGGTAQGRVDETPVSLVDVVPTLLELARVAPPAGLNGRSLAAATRSGAPVPSRPVLTELVPDRQIERDMAAIVWKGMKAIWDREANAWSLFSLRDEADEHDLAEEPAQQATLAELRRLLGQTIDAELGALPETPPSRP